MDQGLSWYPSGISNATSAEYRVAALALVYHATSTGHEKPLKELMTKIFVFTPDYTPDAIWAPPPTWSTSDRDILDQTRDWLEQATPSDHRGTISPVVHVAESTYRIFTTTDSVYRWRRRLCAPLKSNTPTPLLAPSSDPRHKKARLVLMMPLLARMVLTEFEDMDRLLQAAVDSTPMEAVTAPSPFKAEVNRQKAELVVELAKTQVELAETQQSLDAEVEF